MTRDEKTGIYCVEDISGTVVNDILAESLTGSRDNSGYALYKTKCLLCGKTDKKPSYVFRRSSARCDCEEWKKKHAKPLGRRPDPKHGSSVHRLYKQYEKSARERNLPFDLTVKQFRTLIESDCFYCGKKPQLWNKNGTCFGDYYRNGIDRVDNSIGYTIDNCVTCCTECNFGKGTMPKEDFLNWVKRVYEHTFGGR